MNDEIDEIYAESPVYYDDGRLVYDSFEIFYIHYGYTRDSLRNLFPIFVIADQERDRDEAEQAILDVLKSPDHDFYMKTPGRYEPPSVDPSDTTCWVRFIRVTPASGPDEVTGRTGRDARILHRDLYSELRDEQGNLYSDNHQIEGIDHAVFLLEYDYLPEVKIPFPTSRPEGSSFDDHSDTFIPCYLLTDASMQDSTKRIVDVRWVYPRL